MLAPPELRAVHPLGKSPVITDDELVVAETGAIVEYLVDKAGGALRPAAGTPEYLRYRYWLHFAEGSAMLPRMLALYTSRLGEAAAPLAPRIQSEIVIKAEGFASRIDADHFRDGFDWPLEDFRVTSRWGSQRVLNGTPARPHYGIDLAAPEGTVIRAPAAGRVTLAQPGLHFEGGLVRIDHGQGLVTAYLHQSRLEVAAGDDLQRGDPIGRVGMTGRATGPHLCWRMKWRDRNLDPSLMVKT
jgi:murein DD-endopeptidase MepM/ murein hydrolase activator NlpD